MASWETPEQAALRELAEEVEMAVEGVTVERVHHDDHGGWSYWTVIATIAAPASARAKSRETAEMRCVAFVVGAARDLHPGFAATWPQLTP